MFHPRKGMMMISGPKNNYRSLAFCARPLTGRWDPQRDPQRAPLGQDRDERCEAKLTVVLRPGGGQNCIDEAQRREVWGCGP
jgi:hypothetical protein